MSAAQRMQLRSALGPDVVRVADRLQQALADGVAPASLWRELLEALNQHPDLMESPLGQLFTFMVIGRIQKERGSGHPANGLRSALRAR